MSPTKESPSKEIKRSNSNVQLSKTETKKTSQSAIKSLKTIPKKVAQNET